MTSINKTQDVPQWFSSPDTWECPHTLVKGEDRIFQGSLDGPQSILTEWFLQNQLQQKLYHLEKRILFRMLPDFKKTVDGRARLDCCEMSPILWERFMKRMTEINKATPKKKTLSVPGSNFFYKLFSLTNTNFYFLFRPWIHKKGIYTKNFMGKG